MNVGSSVFKILYLRLTVYIFITSVISKELLVRSPAVFLLNVHDWHCTYLIFLQISSLLKELWFGLSKSLLVALKKECKQQQQQNNQPKERRLYWRQTLVRLVLQTRFTWIPHHLIFISFWKSISANGRSDAKSPSRYVFNRAKLLSAGAPSRSVYLGRPWGAYSRVTFQFSHLSDIINPAGWSDWTTTDTRTNHSLFTEFGNTGPGAVKRPIPPELSKETEPGSGIIRPPPKTVGPAPVGSPEARDGVPFGNRAPFSFQLVKPFKVQQVLGDVSSHLIVFVFCDPERYWHWQLNPFFSPLLVIFLSGRITPSGSIRSLRSSLKTKCQNETQWLLKPNDKTKHNGANQIFLQLLAHVVIIQFAFLFFIWPVQYLHYPLFFENASELSFTRLSVVHAVKCAGASEK